MESTIVRADPHGRLPRHGSESGVEQAGFPRAREKVGEYAGTRVSRQSTENSDHRAELRDLSRHQYLLSIYHENSHQIVAKRGLRRMPPRAEIEVRCSNVVRHRL